MILRRRNAFLGVFFCSSALVLIDQLDYSYASCSCVDANPTLESNLETAVNVFEGTVTDVNYTPNPNPDFDIWVVTFDVIRRWKGGGGGGGEGNTMMHFTQGPSNLCGYDFSESAIGTNYLVFSNESSISICSRTIPADSEQGISDIVWLGEPFISSGGFGTSGEGWAERDGHFLCDTQGTSENMQCDPLVSDDTNEATMNVGQVCASVFGENLELNIMAAVTCFITEVHVNNVPAKTYERYHERTAFSYSLGIEEIYDFVCPPPPSSKVYHYSVGGHVSVVCDGLPPPPNVSSRQRRLLQNGDVLDREEFFYTANYGFSICCHEGASGVRENSVPIESDSSYQSLMMTSSMVRVEPTTQSEILTIETAQRQVTDSAATQTVAPWTEEGTQPGQTVESPMERKLLPVTEIVQADGPPCQKWCYKSTVPWVAEPGVLQKCNFDNFCAGCKECNKCKSWCYTNTSPWIAPRGTRQKCSFTKNCAGCIECEAKCNRSCYSDTNAWVARPGTTQKCNFKKLCSECPECVQNKCKSWCYTNTNPWIGEKGSKQKCSFRDNCAGCPECEVKCKSWCYGNTNPWMASLGGTTQKCDWKDTCGDCPECWLGRYEKVKEKEKEKIEA